MLRFLDSISARPRTYTLVAMLVVMGSSTAVRAEAGPGLTKEQIRAVIKASSPEVKACYEDALTRDPALEGDLVVSFVIEPVGGVVDPSVASSDLGDAELEECILGVVGTLAFPGFEGEEVAVSYPFQLRVD